MRSESSLSMSAPRCALVLLGGVICAALTLGSLAPTWAAEPGETVTADLGDFAIGDGIEGAIGEVDGSFGFAVSAGGIELTWDSRALGANRYGLGPAWSIGLPYVEVSGGVRVFPSSGGAFSMDASSPSGLSGYADRDVAFTTAAPGAMVSASRHDAADPVPYAYELHELGGSVTYFDDAGDPVVHLAADGGRTDWIWQAGGSHRLLAIVSADGVETTLDWSGDEVVVRPGSNVDRAASDAGVGGAWRIGLEHDRVGEIIDPIDAVTTIGYDPSGLVARVTGPSGAETVVTWHAGDDAVATARRVSVVNASTRAELSARQWRPGAEGSLASGWPAVDPTSADRNLAATHSAEISDGKTSVSATFDGRQRLTHREVTATTSAGELIVHEQELGYSEEAAIAGAASKPTSSTVTYRDASGGERAATESYEFDALGRMVRRVAPDGATMTRTYDDVVPAGRLVAVGLPLTEQSVAADGSTTSTTYTMNDDRSAPVVAETTTTAPQRAPEVTARTEYTVDHGFVTEQREFPDGDTAATPLVTQRAKSIDLDAGVVSVTQTVAAGTEHAVTSSSRSSLVHGAVLSTTDAAGTTTTSTAYDEATRPVSTVDAAGRVTTTSYRSATVDGVNAVTVTRPDGVAVTEVRDELGRVVEQRDNISPSGEAVDGHVRVFETRDRPAPGVEEVTDAWGATTRIERDLFGRPVEVTLPNGLVEVTRHDDVAGTTTTGSTPTGLLSDAESTVTTTLDDEGRDTGSSGIRADGAPVPETSKTFDGFGREIAVSNGATESLVEHDAIGNPVTTTVRPARTGAEADVAPSPLVAARRFDGFGQSLEKTMTAGRDTRSGGTRELDELGRTIAETDQDGAATRYEYTADGLVLRAVADSGHVTEYTYDDATRAVTEQRVSVGGTTEVTAYEYDERTGELLAVFDPEDRPRTELTYEYDGFGNQKSVQYPSGTPGVPGKRVEHEYDQHGRKVATVDVAGNRTSFSYAADGFLTGVVQVDASGQRELARVAYTPDAHGRVQNIERGNGVVTEYAFTSAGQIASETTTNGGPALAEREYEYDPATGNLLVRVDRVADETGETSIERREYAYDPYGRLIASTVRDGADAEARATMTTAYEIGVSGQVAAETVTTDPGTASAVSTARRFGYSPTGELERITTVGADGVESVAAQEYDAAGNLVHAADGTEYRWDAVGRQIAETRVDGTEISTTYWADGSRRGRSTSAGATRFYWDGATLVNEVHTVGDDPSEGVAAYLIGTSRHARTTREPAEAAQGATAPASPAETRYYGTDRHGNVTALTDGHGATTTTYRYSDYGVPNVSSTEETAGLPGAVGDLARNPFQYASEYAHDDGTQFLQVRTYAPELLSLTSKDGESLHNLYGYADANPIMLVDPTGRMSAMDMGTIALNSFGAASSFIGGLLALSTAGVSLGLTIFGVLAATVGVADAAFTGLETWAIVTDTQFMSDEAAISIGAGLAAIGLGLGVAGGLTKWFGTRGAKAATVAGGGPAAAPIATRTPAQKIADAQVTDAYHSTLIDGIATPQRLAITDMQAIGFEWGKFDVGRMTGEMAAEHAVVGLRLRRAEVELGDFMHDSMEISRFSTIGAEDLGDDLHQLQLDRIVVIDRANASLDAFQTNIRLARAEMVDLHKRYGEADEMVTLLTDLETKLSTGLLRRY
jgi:RHS repeat-associated protein